MNPTQSKNQIRRVFVAYPSLRTFLESTSDPNATLTAWCNMLADCDQIDVGAVVDEIVGGTREPIEKYQKPDQLAFNIRNAANDRRSVRTKRTEQDEKYHQPTRSHAMDWVANQRTGRIAVDLGQQVKSGLITKEENDVRMVELLAWDHGGPVPQWMSSFAEAGSSD